MWNQPCKISSGVAQQGTGNKNYLRLCAYYSHLSKNVKIHNGTKYIVETRRTVGGREGEGERGLEREIEGERARE